MNNRVHSTIHKFYAFNPRSVLIYCATFLIVIMMVLKSTLQFFNVGFVVRNRFLFQLLLLRCQRITEMNYWSLSIAFCWDFNLTSSKMSDLKFYCRFVCFILCYFIINEAPFIFLVDTFNLMKQFLNVVINDIKLFNLVNKIFMLNIVLLKNFSYAELISFSRRMK